MSNRTLITLGVAAVLLYIVWKKQHEAPAAAPQLVSNNLLDWAASPAQDAAYWSLMSGGSPSPAGTHGAAAVTPGTMTQWLGSIFPGYRNAWSAPNAATNPQLQAVAGPPGAFAFPGPVVPAQPTPQSAVESTSPWLPSDFALPAPVSASAWASELTLNDPLAALLVGSGSTIDAVATVPGA